MRQEATGGISGKDVMKLKTAEITEPYQKKWGSTEKNVGPGEILSIIISANVSI